MQCALYPTIVTPFTDKNEIDYASLEKLIDLFSACGMDGIFAVCQSSEMFFMSDEEKLRLAEFSIRACRERGMKCVVSGHTQDALEDQIAYLKALEALKPDAVILVSNRFANEDEDEETLIRNLKRILNALSPETRLGVYECPYPYKRALSAEMLDEMRRDGRFDFIKDTCCRIDEIRNRIERVKGSGIQLYNANSATLYESLQAGAAGYSGVMLNMMPEFFGLLREEAYACAPNEARIEKMCDFISAASVIECQNYPVNAKHMLVKRDIFATERVRNGRPALNESQRKEAESFMQTVDAQTVRLARHPRLSFAFEPDAYFRQCHASSVWGKGSEALAVYFAGTHEKADDVGIWLSKRTEKGWKAPVCIAKVEENTAHWNPVIFPIPGGVRVCFKVGKDVPVWTSWHTESFDGGETWTQPRPYGEACGPVRSKPIRLSDGKLLAPNSVETETAWRTFVDVSVNDGESFERFAEIPLNTDRPDEADFLAGKGAIQPTLWESEAGHVHAFLRTAAGRIFRSDSEDFGKTWCEAYPVQLPNNNSGIEAVKVGKALYLALNPVSGNWAARTPMVILKSVDNGKHFRLFRTLADVPFDDEQNCSAEYSYPSMFFDGQKLHVTFTYHRRTMAYAAIDLKETDA